MWEKGRMIGVFTGVETPTWRELEKLTGRDHKALKQWHELFMTYPEKKKKPGSLQASTTKKERMKKTNP